MNENNATKNKITGTNEITIMLSKHLQLPFYSPNYRKLHPKTPIVIKESSKINGSSHFYYNYLHFPILYIFIFFYFLKKENNVICNKDIINLDISGFLLLHFEISHSNLVMSTTDGRYKWRKINVFSKIKNYNSYFGEKFL